MGGLGCFAARHIGASREIRGGKGVNNLINWELVSEPLNWVIVFLILYFLALLSFYVSKSLGDAGINLM
jgi:hypothetical protein